MPNIEFIAGWIAGGTGVVLGHPLDTIKARLQTGNAHKGIFDAARGIIKRETVFGLYKGMLAPTLTIGFTNSVLFSSYGATLKALHPEEMNVENRKDLPMTEIYLATFVSTICQLVPAIPVELVKTRLQVQQNEVHLFHKSTQSIDGRRVFSGPMEMTREILRKEGVRGLYKGGSVMGTRDCIGYSLYLPVYEGATRVLHERGMGETSTQIVAGGLAGCAGWLSICPIEVVKNRVQTNESLTIGSAIRQVFSEGGVRAFFRGGLVLCLRGFPVNAAIFVVYENSLKSLNRMNGNKPSSSLACKDSDLIDVLSHSLMKEETVAKLAEGRLLN